MIVLKDITKIYNRKESSNTVVAVDSVNLTIPDNTFVSITGKSGSGKSTLLHMIGGVDRPTSGKVIIDDVDIHQLRDKRLSKFRNKTVGFVFQSFLLEPSLNAIENVELIIIYSVGLSIHKDINQQLEVNPLLPLITRSI